MDVFMQTRPVLLPAAGALQHLDAVSDAHAEADTGQTAHGIEHSFDPRGRQVDAVAANEIAYI